MKNILSSSCLHRFIDRVASSYQSLKYLFPYPDRFYGICLHRLGMNHTFPNSIFTVCSLTPIQTIYVALLLVIQLCRQIFLKIYVSFEVRTFPHCNEPKRKFPISLSKMHCGTESIFERSLLLSNEIDKAVNAKWNQNMLSFKFKMAEYIFGKIAKSVPDLEQCWFKVEKHKYTINNQETGIRKCIINKISH